MDRPPACGGFCLGACQLSDDCLLDGERVVTKVGPLYQVHWDEAVSQATGGDGKRSK
jgi:hypothetical protein